MLSNRCTSDVILEAEEGLGEPAILGKQMSKLSRVRGKDTGDVGAGERSREQREGPQRIKKLEVPVLHQAADFASAPAPAQPLL